MGGFLDVDGHLALVPLDRASGVRFVDGPPGLYLAADASPTDLWVGGTEGSYVVAGPVSATPGATDTGVQVWTTGTMDEFLWTQVAFDALPDVVTDMRGWVLDLYLAGPAGQRPVVLEAHGGALEVPDVALDPANPTVLLAEVPTAPTNGRRSSCRPRTARPCTGPPATGGTRWHCPLARPQPPCSRVASRGQ